MLKAAACGYYVPVGTQWQPVSGRLLEDETLLETSHVSLLDEIIRERLVRPVYQPIVDLFTGEIVAYEALARGPQGSPLERPDLLFQVARSSGRVAELDLLCRTEAVRGAILAGMPKQIALFINVEPDVPLTPMIDMDAELWAQATEWLNIVFEITERAVTDDPGGLLAGVEAQRRLGHRVALDDIGADARSLAMLPFLSPEVLKLDLQLVRQRPNVMRARIIHAVEAEAERTGAMVVAEGIETDGHLETARALGAGLGQGWMFGRPGNLPESFAIPAEPLTFGLRRVERPNGTPFSLIKPHRPVRIGTKGILLAMSKHLEEQVLATKEHPVTLAAFQEAAHFTPATAARYEILGKDSVFVGALGHGMASEPVKGVRGASLDANTPLRGEWVVAVVGPHFAGAFAARDLGDEGPDMERRFEYAITYNRSLVLRLARNLLTHVVPQLGA